MTRNRYQDELRRLERSVLDELHAVVRQLSLVLDAVDRADPAIAADVIRGDEEIDRRYAALQSDLMTLIARQAPVATDLRLVTAMLHGSRMIERIGDQSVNVAKLVPVAGPVPPRGAELSQCVQQLGRRALEAVRAAATTLEHADVDIDALAEGDARVNELNRACFSKAIELDGDEPTRAWATAMILMARALERIGDNAVDIGAQLRFAATGTFEPRPAATPAG